MDYISPRAHIDDHVFIGRNVAIIGPCRILSGTLLEDNCIIGKPSNTQLAELKKTLRNKSHFSYADYDAVVENETLLSEDAEVHFGSIVYAGAHLARNVIVRDYGSVWWESTIQDYSKIQYSNQVSAYATVGCYCRIAGFVCNDAVIGNYTSLFGNLIHSYTQYGGGRRDPAPRLGNQVTVGMGAQVIGGVVIEDGSYIAAGAIVTRDVPAKTLVTGCNVQHPVEEWPSTLRDEYHRSFPDDLD